jgi:hypothetical protein
VTDSFSYFPNRTEEKASEGAGRHRECADVYEKQKGGNTPLPPPQEDLSCY